MGHYVAPAWQLQLDLIARYMAVLNSRLNFIIIVITIITIITMFQRELLDLLHGGPPVPERAQADAEDQILPADK